jgi:hypothetical protein
MNFESHSQAGQDRFVWELLGPGPGTFLDIGANHPVEISNTYELERHGWTGALVENDARCVELLKAQRKARLLACDATQVHWESFISKGADYLSLDVDEPTLEVTRRFPWDKIRFKVLTVEHDEYRFNEFRTIEMLGILHRAGYDVLCTAVCDQGLPFEIWAVDPLTVDMTKAEKFRRIRPTDWREFFV